MRLGWNFAPHHICNHTKWLHETVAEILVRKKDAAYRNLKSKLLKEEIAKWNMKDIEATEVKDQRKRSEEEEDNDDDNDEVSLAELLDMDIDKDPEENMEDYMVDYILDGKEVSGLKEEHQETEAKLGEVIEDTVEVLMESIHEMADEDPVETVKASLNDEREEHEKIDEHQPQADDTSSEVAVEENVHIYNVGDEEEPINSTATMDHNDQTNVDAHSEDLGEEESVENVDVSDVIGDEESVELPNSATNKTDEDQTEAVDTFSEASVKEESVESTDSKFEEGNLKPSVEEEPVVSGVSGDEEPDSVTNKNDEDQTKTKTGDTFSDTTIKEESVASDVEELKPLATESTDEVQSETSIPFSEPMFKMESVDVSLVLDEKKPINSTQVPTQDTDEEKNKSEAYIETVVQDPATSESSLAAHNGVKDKVEDNVKENEITEVKEKDNGEDPHNVELNDNVVHDQLHTGDDVIQSDDENNNNNDRKRQPAKRDHVRHGETTKESKDQEDQLHEENGKGITMFIS